jgi:hypothetical protein
MRVGRHEAFDAERRLRLDRAAPHHVRHESRIVDRQPSELAARHLGAAEIAIDLEQQAHHSLSSPSKLVLDLFSLIQLV